MNIKKPDAAPNSSGGRLFSIDALRGFVMLWIIGGDELLKAIADAANWPVKDQVHEQFEHVDWAGFHFYDLIFPLFLFLVGVVLPFSLDKLRDRPPVQSFWRIVRRTVLLFALGLLHNGFLQLEFYTPPWDFNWGAFRIAGVLQRIAICYGIAALLVLLTSWRVWVGIIVVLLAGYWALLAFVPAPGGVAGDYSKEGNLAAWVDRHYLPGKIHPEYYGPGDNEGLLSTIPSVATALLGALAGHWLRSAQSGGRKVLGLAAAGAVCLGAGWLWGLWFPIVKNIWTSSFVLFAGGWSLLLLALFYGIIDVVRLRAWAYFFVVIGANAITIYVLVGIVDFEKIAQFFVGGIRAHAGAWGKVVYRAAIVIVEWLFLLYLYRKRLFLRV
jgi:predicted acyltransferase